MRTATGSLALLILRITLAMVFIAHGLQKLLEQGVAGTASGFAEMGVPFASIVAPLVIALEIGGGVLLALGLGTRMIGALLAVDMLVALTLVHAGSGFFSADGGWEYVFVLAAVSVALAVAGPGRFAIDAAIRSRAGSRRRSLRPAGA